MVVGSRQAWTRDIIRPQLFQSPMELYHELGNNPTLYVQVGLCLSNMTPTKCKKMTMVAMVGLEQWRLDSETDTIYTPTFAATMLGSEHRPHTP